MYDLSDLSRWQFHLVVLSRILIALNGNTLLEKNNPLFFGPDPALTCQELTFLKSY